MKPPVPQVHRPPVIAVTLLSAVALGYEILLMRLFAIVQWHHFAYMIISLALLGYGMSGTFLTLAQRRLLPRFRSVYVANAALTGVAVVFSYLAAQALRFNAEQALWDPTQVVRLVGAYLVLALPFFFAANGVALAFMHCRDQVPRIYAVDLLGAGAGGLGVVLLLSLVFPLTALGLIGSLGLVAAAAAAWELGVGRPVRTVVSLLAGVLIVMVIALQAELAVSPYKSLSQTLRIAGTRVLEQRSSPLGLISVVASPDVPLRHAPGLSLHAATEPPLQIGLFTDADNMTVITRNTGATEALAYLDQLTSALPYHLASPQRVLVLGAGGGADVLQARYHKVPAIDAVELNPQIVDLVRGRYGQFAGDLYDAPGVSVHVAEARGFVVSHARQFDLIQVALFDAFAASSAGLYALSESYLYTVEALGEYLAHLRPGGYLAITRWVTLPPRDVLKLFATAVDALRAAGVDDPGQRMLLIRGLQTSTLVIKNGAVTSDEIAALRAFCTPRAFDLAWYPGMTLPEANRFNRLEQPYFYLGASAILSDARADFFTRYKFRLEPATDDRPYFFHFAKWAALPELFALRERGGMALLEWGYFVLVATLVQALVASTVLILLPLVFQRRSADRGSAARLDRVRILSYFGAIGLAFLFIEIAFMQKFILFLHHPVYAAAVVLSAFLLFGGLGSAWSQRQVLAHRNRRAAVFAVMVIASLSVVYAAVLGDVFTSLAALPTAVRAGVAVALIAPLAFAMGMPFPLAMDAVGARAPALIPWAWAVNGCASVLSAVLAALLAVHLGFTVVVLLAAALYGLALLSFPGWDTAPPVPRADPG